MAASPELQPDQPPDPADFQDPAYREAVIDLLGVVSYGEISAFERLAEDAKMAPDIRDKVALASMASATASHMTRRRVRDVCSTAIMAHLLCLNTASA